MQGKIPKPVCAKQEIPTKSARQKNDRKKNHCGSLGKKRPLADCQGFRDLDCLFSGYR